MVHLLYVPDMKQLGESLYEHQVSAQVKKIWLPILDEKTCNKYMKLSSDPSYMSVGKKV